MHGKSPGVKNLIKIVGFLCVGLAFFLSNKVSAQSKNRVIQLSGVVLSNDSINPLPGAHIYVPAAGRGTSSNTTGFFSLPLLTGDSVVFSMVGYKRRHFVIPYDAVEYTTLVVVMSEDTTLLPQVDFVLYPTEYAFKEALVAMNLPMQTSAIDPRLMNNELMALMIRTTPMDASANYKYYMSQMPQDIQNRFMPITNPFLNVFNWAKFFKTLKQTKKAKEAESQRNRIPD